MIPHRFGTGGVARPTIEEATLYAVLLLLVSLLLSLAFAGKAEAYAPITFDRAPRIITRDDGGMIRGEYLPRINASIAARQAVIIQGWCASACTYELRSPYACVTPGAQLHFHASPALPHVARMPDSHWMVQLYPARLQGLIRAYGGLTHAGFTVTGAQLAASGAARLCG